MRDVVDAWVRGNRHSITCGERLPRRVEGWPSCGVSLRAPDPVDHLDQVNWAAVASTDFRDATVKEGKQAEFLLHEQFPWRLVRRVGARTAPIRDKAASIIAQASHQPPVDVLPGWYY